MTGSYQSARSTLAKTWHVRGLTRQAKRLKSKDCDIPETYIEDSEGIEGLYFNQKSLLAEHLFANEGIPALRRWSKWYKAPWWLQQGDLMTMLAGSLREVAKLDAPQKLSVQTLGGEMPLDLFSDPSPTKSKAVILIPGLGGSTEGGYVKNMAESLIHSGFVVAGLNLGSALQRPRSASAHRGSSDDLRAVAKYIRQNLLSESPSADRKVFAIGWSLGGNILVNTLAEQKTKEGYAHDNFSLIDGGVALCTTHCLSRCATQWEQHWPMRNVYDPHVLRNLKRLLEPAIPFYQQGPVRSWNGTDTLIDHKMLKFATRIRDVDEALIRRMFGYKSVEDYYYQASSCRRLAEVEVPLLMVSAADDPMATSWAPFKTVRGSKHVILAYTKHGGHIGWQDESNARKSEWVEDVATSFLNRLLTF